MTAGRWVAWPACLPGGDWPLPGLLAVMAAIAVWAFRPWTASVPLAPADNNTPQAVFRCSAPFGGDSVEPANGVARSATALPYQPCTARRSRQLLAVADFVVGGLGIALLVAVGRQPPVDDDAPASA